MTGDRDFTLQLGPHSKTRFAAGPYDPKTQTPRYGIETEIWGYLRHEVETTQFLMGTEGNYTWVWDIENKSDWPAFISITRDGELVRM